MVSRRTRVASWIFRRDHPSRPKAMICCFLSSFKTFAMLREATYPPAAVNVLDVSSESMAAFQVFLYGRFWVFTEDLQTIFGISLDTYVPSAEDLILYVYPEDRQRVSRALDDAKQNREPSRWNFASSAQTGRFGGSQPEGGSITQQTMNPSG